MAITILPTWGDYIGKGLETAGEAIGAGLKKRYEIQAEKEKNLAEINALKEIYGVSDSPDNETGNMQENSSMGNPVNVKPIDLLAGAIQSTELGNQASNLSAFIDWRKNNISNFGGAVPSLQEAFTAKKLGVEMPGLFNYKLAQDLYKKGKEAEINVWEDRAKGVNTLLGKSNEQKWQNDAAFRAAGGMLEELVAYKKGQFEEQGGRGDVLANIIGGIQSQFRLKGKGRTGALQGQIDQAVMRMSPLLTGSKRLLKSVMTYLRGALPDWLDPSEQTAQKISQTLSDFFRYKVAWERTGITPEQFDQKDKYGNYVISDEEAENMLQKELDTYKMSKEEKKFIEAYTEQVLATPAATPRDLISGKNNDPLGIK